MNQGIAMHIPDTKQRILDTAEMLFARNGYRGTSLRSITGKAHVNLASVNYHFGSKTGLLEAVIRRRILPLNLARRKRLELVRHSAREKGQKPDVRAVLLAFIEPTLLFMESGTGAKDFITFIGRSFTDPDDTVRKVFLRFIMPIFRLLSETMRDALPHHHEDVIFWRLHFTMGALFHTMHICGNINMGSKDSHHDIDPKSLIDQIIPYVTAGMKTQ